MKFFLHLWYFSVPGLQACRTTIKGAELVTNAMDSYLFCPCSQQYWTTKGGRIRPNGAIRRPNSRLPLARNHCRSPKRHRPLLEQKALQPKKSHRTKGRSIKDKARTREILRRRELAAA